MTRMATAILLFASLAAGACSRDEGGRTWNFERMLDQRRGDAYRESSLFADGKVMRTPPRGAVPYGTAADRELREARKSGSYVSELPLLVDRALLDRGRNRFEIFCAPCHGIAGDGESVVAEAMPLRKPPSLVDPRIAAFPVGRLYEVVSTGYGLMPGYADELAVRDRWAIIGYLRALEKSRAVHLADLPPKVRRDLTGGAGP